MKLNNILTTTTIYLLQLLSPASLLNAREQRVDTVREEVIQQYQTRASFDIGSGKTKITVADVDSNNKIVKIWHESFIIIGLQADFAKNGFLSEEVEQQLISALNQMKKDVEPFAPKKWSGAATSIFRTAENGQAFLKRIKSATDIDIHVISQNEEAEIGFATVVAASNEASENIIAWDMGSGSFQISSLIDGNIEMYGEEFSYISALETLFKSRQEAFSNVSPNPITREEAFALINVICGKLKPIPSWLREHNKQIGCLGTGIDSIFSHVQIATGNSQFKKQEVLEALLRLCGQSDDQLNPFPSPSKVIVFLALVYGIMDHCEMDQATSFSVNGNCAGILETPRFWE